MWRSERRRGPDLLLWIAQRKERSPGGSSDLFFGLGQIDLIPFLTYLLGTTSHPAIGTFGVDCGIVSQAGGAYYLADSLASVRTSRVGITNKKDTADSDDASPHCACHHIIDTMSSPAYTVTAPIGPMSYHGTHPSITARIAGNNSNIPQAAAGGTSGNDAAAAGSASAASAVVSSSGTSAKGATTPAGAAETVPVEKVKRYVTARCGRCGTHLSNWTVKTPVCRSSDTNGMIADSTASAETGAAALSIATAPGDPASAGDLQPATAPAICDPDPSDLFPSHVKKTWLGPESVLVFPNILGAKALLGKAVELDLSKANDLAIDHQDDITGEHREAGKAPATANFPPLLGGAAGAGHHGGAQGQNENAAPPSLSEKTNGGSGSAASVSTGTAKIANGAPGPEGGAAHSHWSFGTSDDKVSHALACPACSFLLASSPTCPYLGVKGRTVIYQPSLRLESTTDVPTASTEPNSPASASDGALPAESALGTNQDAVPTMIKPRYHDALPLIRSKKEFEEILQRSALAPITHFADRTNSKSNIESTNSFHSESSSDHPILRSQGSAESNEDSFSTGGDGDGDSDNGEVYGTENPAELVIVVVGQFWSPYSVSAVTLLSDYKRRHEPGGAERRNSAHVLSGVGAGPSIRDQFARPHRRTVSVPPNLASVSSAAASSSNKSKPGHKSTRSTGAEEAHGGGSHSVPACTFLLLDTFHNAGSVGDGEGGGGVDPSAVLGKELASTVRCLPIPFFLVWYRGCPVRVTNASQHFRCQRGAVVGLDLARYVDIVVPRIAAEARQAFRRSLLSARAAKNSENRRSSELVPIDMDENESSEQTADADGLFWSQVTDVPELKGRPTLDIKL